MKKKITTSLKYILFLCAFISTAQEWQPLGPDDDWPSHGRVSYTNIAVAPDGTPYVLYSDFVNDQKATVRRYNGTAWEVVGSAGFSAGRADYTDIALAGDGTPYVVYLDSGNSFKATVQRFNGTAWEVVGSSGFSAGGVAYTNISLSGDGTPYVVYYDGDNSGKATVQRFNGTAWEVLGIAGFSAGRADYTDIALSGDGTPYVVYVDGSNSNKATVQRFNGTAWEVVGIAGFSTGGAGSANIALAGDGTPYVVYADGAIAGKATVRRFNGTSWEVVGSAGFSSGITDYTVITVASDGTPYVVYQDASNNKATVQRFNGIAWEVEGPGGFSSGIAIETDIALAGDGTPYVVYLDYENSNRATVQRFNGTAWEVVGSAGFSSGFASSTDIALASDGTPYVVYRDAGNSFKATVQRFNGTAWEVVGNSGFSTGIADFTKIDLASDGTPYVVYRDGGNSVKATVKRFNGTSWEVVGAAGFSADIVNFTDIALARDGTPYVVYRDGGNSLGATVQRFNGTSWEVVGAAGFSAGDADWTNIALSADGVPYVVYQDAGNFGKATVQRFNGTAWEVVGSTGFSAAGAAYTDIELSADGTPYVVYRDGANSLGATVQRFNGTSWEVVGSTGFSAGSADYTDIAFSGDGTPYVVYTDVANFNKATVQRFNGTAWEVVGTVGFTNGIANYTSMAIDNQGNITVVYSSGYAYAKTYRIASADQEVPSITCTTDIVQSAGSSCSTTVAISAPTATDNVSTVFTFEGIRSDGAALDALFPVGNTTITWTATDEAGNVSESCDQLVTVTGTGDCWVQLGMDVNGEMAGDLSGRGVSLNAAGTRMAIGARQNGGNGVNAGHVRVFEIVNGSWVQLGSDIDGGAPEERIGFTLAMNAIGNRVVIGASGMSGNGERSGGFRVYEYNGADWVQLGSDVYGETAGDGLSGFAITMNASGNRVAAGSIANDGNGVDAGHVRIYELIGGNWSQLGADIDGEAEGDQSGRAVSLSADGSRVAIGAYFNDGNGADSGHVRIFDFDGANWNQVGTDIDGEAAGDWMGQSVSLSDNGNLLAVGASLNSDNGQSSGQVRIYEFNGTTWNQRGGDIDGDAAGDQSGYSIKLSASGSRVAIGALGSSSVGNQAGQVRVFEYKLGSWVLLGNKIAGEKAGDRAGGEVSFSKDGQRFAAGAPYNDGNGEDAGHVRVFGYTGTIEDSQAPVITCPNAITGVSSGGEPISINLLDPTATDNVSSNFTFQGTRSDNLPLTDPFKLGDTTISWTATDEAGNTSNPCDQIVTIGLAETEIILDNTGALNIFDANGGSSDDVFTMTLSGDNLRIVNTVNYIKISGDGVVQIDANTIEIPLSSITNGITLNGEGGTNTVNIDTALSLSGPNNFLTLININAVITGGGNLQVNALNVNNGNYDTNGATTTVVTVANFDNGATLSGNGTIVGDVNINNSAILGPGTSPGILGTGNLNLAVGAIFNAEVNGPIPGTDYDQLSVIGSVEINNASLNLIGGYANAPTDVIVLIANDGSDVVQGTFLDLPEGAAVAFGAFSGIISYKGGDGNDVVLKGIISVSLSVTSFVLVDADTDRDIMTLTNGSFVDVGSLPTTNLNIRANTTSDVRSVRLVLSGALANKRTENLAPYALYGDSNGNYAGQIFPLGKYSLTATPYSATGLGGTLGTPLALNFELTNNPNCAGFDTEVSLSPFENVQATAQPFALTGGLPAGGTYSGIGVSGGFFDPSIGAGTYSITYTITNGTGCSKSTAQNIRVVSNNVLSVTSFVLVDADTDRDIMTLTNGSFVDVGSLPTTNLNIRANTTSDVRSVRLVLSGALANTRTENLAPYALYGDSNGNYAGQIFPLGKYSLTGTPYSATGLGGTLGTPLTLNFELTNNPNCAGFETEVSLSPFENVQASSQPFALTGGLPAGGTYSGIGVSGGFFDPSIGAGTYSITYTITNGTGCSKSTAQNIRVVSNNVLTVTSFVLVDADTDRDIMTLTNGSFVDVGSLPTTNLNIRANTTSDVRSVRLVLSGALANTRTENLAPYALYGDSNGNYAGQIFPLGKYSLTGTPYSATGLGGTLGTPLTLNFELVSTQGTLAAKQSNDMSIYPNPAKSATTASFKLPIKVKTIMVFDMIGRLVRTYRAEEVKNGDGYGLDLNFIQPGSYIIKTIDEQGNQFQKQMAIEY